ncbi:hypothetical protein D3H55_08870 [Bacillus salacetis]|uniref:YtkA-like domain-containing protein n=1 Tax=Bacillus salacetis TaxID=2315464 RepID=A0A3A1R4H1_9BACI|nr:FixH family protein [Bacillus salacetis]RIW34751.1 hypothetical protein D3H55_08870 [Bacillus salacetis]
MKKTPLLISLMLVGFLLNACSLRDDAAELYHLEQPLKAEINIPSEFSASEEESIEAVLTQNGKKVENPDFVHFEIWKQDGSLHYPMEEAEVLGNGIYRVSKEFNQDGLYFVKVHASSEDSLIIPQKQFIVGELTESELEFLQEGTRPDTPAEEHHH